MIKQAPFKPTDIGGCKAWFDAYDASYTTTGNTVTAWTNKSGNANATTGSGTVSINQTTLNGKSSVRFAAGTNYLNIGSISYSTSYRNQFFVVTVGASGSFYFYLNCNDTICGQCYSWNNSDIEINRSGLNGIVTSNPTGFFSSTSFVSICTSSGGNTGIWVNGSNQTLSVNNVGTGGFFSAGTASGITLGGQNGFTTGNLDMYELLQYDGDLTTSQRQQVESYLAQKWGLRQQLPQGHPGTRGIVYPSQPIPTAIYWRYDTNPAGISRPANVLPIPPITCTPVSRIRTLVTQIFSYTGALQTYSVPAGVTSVVLYMWGAGGGTSQSVGGFVNYSGGAGAMVQGVYPVTPASTLYVVVGKGGVTNQSAQTDAQGGGGAANSAGGGGGRSAIQLTSGGADVVVAGGGGGGGLLYANNNGTGGPAYFSGSSPNTLAAVTGYGGTQTAGGAAGGNGNVPGNPGTLKFGGAGTGPGGGGGGGYYGGGGMGNGDQGWDPGAGGSSLIDNLSLIPGESVFGFNSTNLSGAPNTTSPYYVSNVAAGGIGANATGGNGRVVVGCYL